MIDTHLEVLGALEPFTTEIVGIVDREAAFEPTHNKFDLLGLNYRYADYLTTVDGDDYVVSVADHEIKNERIPYLVAHAADSQIYATDSEISRLWIAQRRSRIGRLTDRFKPLFSGSVHVTPRDAYDIFESHGELSRGMIGYSLRRGKHAVLHSTGGMPDDVDFFMGAIRAVHPANQIDQNTRFTSREHRHFEDVHKPIIDLINRLIDRDGMPPKDAYERYLQQYDLDRDSIRKIAIALDTDTWISPALKTKSESATYKIRNDDHLMLTRRGNGNISAVNVLREQVVDGVSVVTEVTQSLDQPNMLLMNKPSGDLISAKNTTDRLFSLTDAEALDLNALLMQMT